MKRIVILVDGDTDYSENDKSVCSILKQYYLKHSVQVEIIGIHFFLYFAPNDSAESAMIGIFFFLEKEAILS